MKRTKFIIFILFIGLLFLIITGCSNYNEINNVMIVDGIGIDKIDDKYIISFNTYLENDKYEVIDIEVNTIDEAFSDIYLLSNKRIYLSHLNILLLSSNLSNKDITNIFNTFNNRDDLRGTFIVSLVNDYDKNIFSNESLFLVNLINNNHHESGDVYPTTFNDILSDYLDLNISYIPVINNKDLSIIGMHSIFSEFRHYNLNEAKYLNLILNKSSSLIFDIDNEEVHINDISIDYEVNNNHLTIFLNLIYSSNLNDKEIKTYLNDRINYLLDLDINNNYFLNLIKKYDYSYYKSHDYISISYDLDFYLKKDTINNIKEDDLFEEDY